MLVVVVLGMFGGGEGVDVIHCADYLMVMSEADFDATVMNVIRLQLAADQVLLPFSLLCLFFLSEADFTFV